MGTLIAHHLNADFNTQNNGVAWHPHYRKEKAIQFSIYYNSRENGDYLRQVVDSSGIGQVKNFQSLEGLNGDHTVDVVLLEYRDNNPALDCWIAQTTAQPECPEIFLFVEDVSPTFIWKTLKMGARELFAGAIHPKEFQEAILRVGVRKVRPARQ